MDGKAGVIDDFKREMIRSSENMIGLEAAMFTGRYDAGELLSSECIGTREMRSLTQAISHTCLARPPESRQSQTVGEVQHVFLA